MRTVLIVLGVVLVTATSSSAITSRLITSRDIKNGTIQPIDLSANARKIMRGRVGPAGPQGPQGAQGERGPAGFSSLNMVIGPQANISPGEAITSYATCTSGKVFGGGFWTSDPDIAPFQSLPWGATEWKVQAFDYGNTYGYFYAYALCAG